MKKKFSRLIMFCMLIVPSISFAADSLYIQVRKAKLRSTPKHYGKILRTMKYGQKLNLINSEEDTGWFSVAYGNTKGFIHKSAVTERKVEFQQKSKGSTGNFDNSEIATAGKGVEQGWDKNIERKYASQNGSLNFKAVDQMERVYTADSELTGFRKAGKLNQEG